MTIYYIKNNLIYTQLMLHSP